MSWDEAFAHGYDEGSARATPDVDFHVSLAREANGPPAELAIGNGRVAIPVAQASANTATPRCRTRCATPSPTGASTSLWTPAARARCAWATNNEYLGLLDIAGLQLEWLFGSFNRKPLTEASGEYILLTRLQGSAKS